MRRKQVPRSGTSGNQGMIAPIRELKQKLISVIDISRLTDCFNRLDRLANCRFQRGALLHQLRVLTGKFMRPGAQMLGAELGLPTQFFDPCLHHLDGLHHRDHRRVQRPGD